MEGWCEGKTAYQVYPAGEVLSFVEELHLVYYTTGFSWAY